MTLMRLIAIKYFNRLTALVLIQKTDLQQPNYLLDSAMFFDGFGD